MWQDVLPDGFTTELHNHALTERLVRDSRITTGQQLYTM